MEVSVKEYGGHSDKEITDQALPPLVDWAETPGIVRNVRRTSHRLMELFANDGADARTILRHIPYGTKLGLSIRLYAPDIQDNERGLPDDIRLTRYMRVGRPSPGVVVETELYRLGNVLRGRDLSGLDLRYLDFSGVDLCDVDMSGADLRGSLIDSGTPLANTVFRDADMRRMRFLGTLKAVRPVYLENADLREADFSRANVSWFQFNDSDMSGAILRNAVFECTNMKGVNLAGADATGASLGDIDLREANLTGAVMDKAFLDRTVMSDATVGRTSVHGLRIRRGNVRRVDFGQAHGAESMFFENTKTKGSTLPRGFVNHYYDASLIAQGNGWRLNYRNNGLNCVLTFDWRNGCPDPRTLGHTPEWEEMGRRDRVEEIRFVPGSKAPEDMSAFFEDMFALHRVDFTNLDMSKTVSLAWMFNNSGFRDVEIVNLKAPNAKDCERLFRLGPDVTSLKVPGLDVSGAEVAREMFASPHRITELDLSELRLPRVKDINRMFMYCERLRRLDISNLELPPDVEMDNRGPAMFSNCVSLEYVDMPTKGALADRYGETMKRFNAGDRAVLKTQSYPRVTVLSL
ncbi:pentapeptide repeat-containing protein [Bifidobacterium catenulatum]|uniref:Pentapeptide repeat-containing protein n=1 Tax=Bifidobacterium catenulatum subsp. kashiwanohense TaxID=630129 RepID=A0AA43P6B2_9BIFI|nr:pentapeptide repeat-containing protein [Bifidobacterium catenulatum]MDH7889149.1 pentapeptide repeat-containing protein [Bifidobacterium catenulatum subsp. kashiwanohense]